MDFFLMRGGEYETQGIMQSMHVLCLMNLENVTMTMCLLHNYKFW